MKYFFAVLIAFSAALVQAQPANDAEMYQKMQLARVYESSRDFQNALRLYEELFKVKPGDRNIADGYIRSLYALKKFSEVETVITGLLQNKPVNSFELYILLGRTQAQLNHRSDALASFKKAEEAAGQADPYSSSLTIANTMVDAGFESDALELLIRQRDATSQREFFTPEIAQLYFRSGEYKKGVKEFLSYLQMNESNLAIIQGRLAQFTTDSSLRKTIMKLVISEVDTASASFAELRLVGWCYGELRDYQGALAIYLAIESHNSQPANPSAGIELYQFAERALAEKAYPTAAIAYDEAVKRMERAAKGGMSTPATSSMIFMAELGSLKARQAMIASGNAAEPELRDLVNRYETFASGSIPNDVAIGALLQAGDLSFHQLHDLNKAKSIYEQIVKRSSSLNDVTKSAYFALEEIGLTRANTQEARAPLIQLQMLLARRARQDDIEIKRHVILEFARCAYFDGLFDSVLVMLTDIINVPASDYANDAIALQTLITENREGSGDAAMKVFAKSELLGLGSDLNGAISGYLSIRQNYTKSLIADEATLRAADLEVTIGKWTDAITLLQQMQEQMTGSPLVDKAALREAEITERQLGAKGRALKLYEEFLARYPKSPYCTEVRQRARKLRGDTF